MRAHRYSALRQLGKLTFWRAVDVGRFASRAIGAELARRHHLGDPEDVFFLVGDEFIPEIQPDLCERVAIRKAQRTEYEAFDMPLTWIGNPEPIPGEAAPELDSDAFVTGIGVSPGRIEGLARVVRDPMQDEPPQPGEILVCHSTDPSWVGLFQLSAALVIDVGGPMSHGAIVARELGVPCVINTRTGTRRIRTGERLCVDGSSGRVERIG
jgi:pyruvate,water dikinase